MPRLERYRFYPSDFVIKGFPRVERTHRDPPAVHVDMKTKKLHYAIVCGVYQLHGEEGERACLIDKKGTGADRSIAAEPRLGDPQVRGDTLDTIFGATNDRAKAAAAPKTNAKASKTAPPPMMSGALTPRSPCRAFEAEDLPTGAALAKKRFRPPRA
ncbi:hypothetical protein MMC07_005716 [Pseudocyphellaria aurata]|nr:hypothetical protein [Pseudocyphellaria aurata]